MDSSEKRTRSDPVRIVTRPKPTPVQEFTAAAFLVCAASWGALIWGVVTWWRDALDLDDLEPGDDD
jgi:hypothetical protein